MKPLILSIIFVFTLIGCATNAHESHSRDTTTTSDNIFKKAIFDFNSAKTPLEQLRRAEEFITVCDQYALTHRGWVGYVVNCFDENGREMAGLNSYSKRALVKRIRIFDGAIPGVFGAFEIHVLNQEVTEALVGRIR